MGEFYSAVAKITGDTFVLGDETEPTRLAEELGDLKSSLKGPLVVCVGGGAGNRGRDVSPFGLERLEADENGMVASVLNASTLIDAFGGRAIGFTGVSQYVLEQHAKYETDPLRKAAIGLAIVNLTHESELRALKKVSDKKVKQDILVAGGGIGRGHVSTDLGAALFARDLVSPDRPAALLKGSGVDGVYPEDPKVNPAAEMLKHVSYDQALEDELGVIDLSAWPILKQGGVVTFVYRDAPGNMQRALSGEIGSRVDNRQTGLVAR
jgi:uridylate kinase